MVSVYKRIDYLLVIRVSIYRFALFWFICDLKTFFKFVWCIAKKAIPLEVLGSTMNSDLKPRDLSLITPRGFYILFFISARPSRPTLLPIAALNLLMLCFFKFLRISTL